jgi:DNA-directed RNA polymerase subunit alpha
MLIAQRPTLTEETITEQRSRFVIEPLEPGFGYTLGNSLRRTLLSSIPGAAVTSIRIEGTLHEFTTVPGVKEDVTDLILNLTELVVSSESDEPVVMYLRKQGPGPVTAADIAPPAEASPRLTKRVVTVPPCRTPRGPAGRCGAVPAVVPADQQSRPVRSVI